MAKPRINTPRANDKPKKALKPATTSSKKTIDENWDTIGKPKFLIVCEGSTEAAYFSVLKEKYKLNADILPLRINDESNSSMAYKSDLAGLLITAMQKQKKTRYNHVWVVTDNDEGNGYKLDDSSLDRIKKICSPSIYTSLEDEQLFGMDVRIADAKEKMRVRYFLNYQAYFDFLTSDIGIADELLIGEIIDLTTYKEDFTLLYSRDPKGLFYDESGDFIVTLNRNESDFDPKWKEYINIAYSSISFEIWLLLHFEYPTKSFYNSREVIYFFDTKNYFLPTVPTPKNNYPFKKGWYLYEKCEIPEVKAFFKQINHAIENNIKLLSHHQTITAPPFYERNPYTDVAYLTAQLLNKTICLENQTLLQWSNFKDIHHKRMTNTSIEIELTYIGKASLKRDSEILIEASPNNEISFLNGNIIVRTNDTITIKIEWLSPTTPPFEWKIKHDNQTIQGLVI